MIDSLELERLKSIPIEQVAEALGLSVYRHKCLCPFHEDRHPSLSFHLGKNTFKCFVCGEHGNTISLVMKVRGLEFIPACCWLAQCFGISISMKNPPRMVGITPRLVRPVPKPVEPEKPDLSRLWPLLRKPSLNALARDFLFRQRRYKEQVVQWLGIGSKDEELLIPYWSMAGELITVQVRYLTSREGRPRFWFPRGSRCQVYGQLVLRFLKPGEPLYIAEGVTDCIALLSMGHKAIAIPSATLLKSGELQDLLDEVQRRLYGDVQIPLNLHMFPDRDKPGEELFRQLQDIYPQIIRHGLPQDCKDFSDYYIKLKQ
ncbi:MAG: hypothetical protein IKH95_10545 [Bacteroidaceae bacterium]|nr:hypothetical protein [Bacteroidaceae bacterium]